MAPPVKSGRPTMSESVLSSEPARCDQRSTLAPVILERTKHEGHRQLSPDTDELGKHAVMMGRSSVGKADTGAMAVCCVREDLKRIVHDGHRCTFLTIGRGGRGSFPSLPHIIFCRSPLKRHHQHGKRIKPYQTGTEIRGKRNNEK